MEDNLELEKMRCLIGMMTDEVSPTNILKEHGVEFINPYNIAKDLMIGEIRIHPGLGISDLSKVSCQLHDKIYADTWNNEGQIFTRNYQRKTILYCSKETDICQKTGSISDESLQEAPNKTMNFQTGITEGYVLRLFYSTPDDCFADLNDAFLLLDKEFDIMSPVIDEIYLREFLKGRFEDLPILSRI